jgi:tetratricopeptide (TPR) repeat protein
MFRRLTWLSVLVLAALGGAGLASAADRPPTDETRPELTWRADQIAGPWIEAMGAQLRAVEEELGTLAAAGRQSLERLPQLDPAAIEAALAEGDASSRRLAELLATLKDMRAQQLAAVNDTRLSNSTQQRLAVLDAAIDAADEVTFAWPDVAAAARGVTRLLDALVRHDGLVFRATTAGRQERFADALDLLDQAQQPLSDARAVRDELAAYTRVDTLDDLLGRYTVYDAALHALYDEINDSGTQDSPRVRELLAAVERAQSALPADTSALQVIVAEAAGPSVANGLITIERARGVVAEALGDVP